MWGPDGERTLECEDALMIMNAIDGLPLMTVEKSGFQLFAQKLCPSYEILDIFFNFY